MEFYDVVGKRRTIRDFTEMPVNTDSVKRILSAGLKAPTNDHMRNWEFVVVTEKQNCFHPSAYSEKGHGRHAGMAFSRRMSAEDV